jgi:hypothetical protein
MNIFCFKKKKELQKSFTQFDSQELRIQIFTIFLSLNRCKHDQNISFNVHPKISPISFQVSTYEAPIRDTIQIQYDTDT